MITMIIIIMIIIIVFNRSVQDSFICDTSINRFVSHIKKPYAYAGNKFALD